MAYDSTKPVTGSSPVAADVRENFRALKEDGIVIGADLVAGKKDPAAGTAGLRTLGTGALQAGAGNVVAVNTAKVTNATHTGDVTGATALTIGASKVTQAKLKTTTAEDSMGKSIFGDDSMSDYIVPTGGQYMLGKAFKYTKGAPGTLGAMVISCDDHASGVDGLTTAYGYSLYHAFTASVSVDASVITSYIRWDYVNASGELVWLFIKRDKITKEVHMNLADNHPCFATTRDPVKTPHPFLKVSETEEITCCILTDDQWDHICDEAENYGDSKLHALTELYEVDEMSKPEWPTKEVTVGLPKKIEVEIDGKMVMKPVDWRFKPVGTKITPIKKVIPKPDYVICKSLKKKG